MAITSLDVIKEDQIGNNSHKPKKKKKKVLVEHLNKYVPKNIGYIPNHTYSL